PPPSLRPARNAAAAPEAAAPTRQALPDATPPTDRGRSGIPRRGGGAAQRLGIELAFERLLAGGDDERHRPAAVDNRDVEQRSGIEENSLLDGLGGQHDGSPWLTEA